MYAGYNKQTNKKTIIQNNSHNSLLILFFLSETKIVHVVFTIFNFAVRHKRNVRENK